MVIIKLKNSNVQGLVPDPAELSLGEIGINTSDGKIFLKKQLQGVDSIVEIGASSDTLSELEKIQEGSNIGWRVLGRNTTVYNDIGLGAIDFTYMDPLELGTLGGASGAYSFTSGKGNSATNTASYAEGHYTKSTGHGAHAEGSGTLASNNSSHAEGIDTTSSGIASHVEGSLSIASGDYSHAEGSLSIASGENSHAEGFNTVSHNYASHSEGQETTAGGVASHAEGAYSSASGTYSHAEGEHTLAAAIAAHAEGYGTIASGPKGAHAQGTFNNAGDTIISSIGIGIDNDNRANAFEVYTDGTVRAPELTIDLINTTRSLTTKEYVDAVAGSIGASALVDLTDTDITGQTDGDLIIFNSTSGLWENSNSVDGGTF